MDGLKSRAKKGKGASVDAKAPKLVPVITMGSASALIKQLTEAQAAKKVPKNKRSYKIYKKEKKVFNRKQSKRRVVASVRRESILAIKPKPVTRISKMIIRKSKKAA